MESLERKLGKKAQGIVSEDDGMKFERDLDQDRTPFFEPYDDEEENNDEDDTQQQEPNILVPQ